MNIRPLLEELYAELGDDMTVLQIGANDGEQDDMLGDFLLTSRCQAVLVEPVT